MLYPKTNAYRQFVDLSGFWDFCLGAGEQDRSNGFDDGDPIAVPASWNDQYMLERENLGPAWYQTHFDLPWGFDGKRVFLRFGSVNYLAEVWLNGSQIGLHEGGNMAFEFEVTDQVQSTDNRLVVRVDGELAPDRVPPGNIPPTGSSIFANMNFPASSFDFYPFTGIQRPVLLYALPQDAITDLTVITNVEGQSGRVNIQVLRAGNQADSARFTLRGHGVNITYTLDKLEGEQAQANLDVPDAALWAPGHPNLYDLRVELLSGKQVLDQYDLPLGIRTVEVRGDQLLLNGEPVYLTGFGRHEDFPVVGRGYLPAVIIRDYELLKWIGANSFRTSHYPYSEQMMDLADRLGFLVIDETSAVGLYFDEQGLARRLELCKQYTRELIARDKNHPSVIAWSLANEPQSRSPVAKDFFRQLYDLAKSLDDTRLVTVVSMMGVDEEAFEFCELMCVNRYFGWYMQSGRIEEGVNYLSKDLDALYDKYHKPIIITEFGADALPGQHAVPPEMFSEEYQAELILREIEVMRSKPFVIGEHVWNLCDFKTAQAVFRTNAMNYKGVFTRDRRPKLAAHRLRALWTAK